MVNLKPGIKFFVTKDDEKKYDVFLNFSVSQQFSEECVSFLVQKSGNEILAAVGKVCNFHFLTKLNDTN